MSKRKNGTIRAARLIGANPYGWGNGKGRKRPKEYRMSTKMIPQRMEPQEDQAHNK